MYIVRILPALRHSVVRRRCVVPGSPEPPHDTERFFVRRFHLNVALIDTYACIVAASHLRFAPSRSIP